nr:hypothetical protein [Tanacetum cinerariifolium]
SGFDQSAYSDADHAGCHLDRKMKSEYVDVSGCCAQVLWMRTQSTDYGFFFDKLPIYCDSKSAIAISCNPEVYRQCDKWTQQEILKFMEKMEEHTSKRYNSGSNSSFNTRESGEGSFNLNITTRDEEDEVQEKEDEVQEVLSSRPMGRDQAKRKGKAGTSSTSSATSFDDEWLAKLMVNEYANVSGRYNVKKGQEMTELLQMKKKELEFKAAELKIQRMDQRQKDKALYLSTTDEELKRMMRRSLTF